MRLSIVNRSSRSINERHTSSCLRRCCSSRKLYMRTRRFSHDSCVKEFSTTFLSEVKIDSNLFLSMNVRLLFLFRCVCNYEVRNTTTMKVRFFSSPNKKNETKRIFRSSSSSSWSPLHFCLSTCRFYFVWIR